METEKYVVLRSREISAPPRGDMGARAGAALPAGLRRQVVKLEEVELSKRERNDLRRDPSTRAIALPMPLRLIEPVRGEPAVAAAGPAWGIGAVRAPESTYDGSGIIVAVLDTGIDPNHPAFAGMQLVQRNFTEEGPNDLHGHGSHCAGTIFGQDVQGTRIGVARKIKRALIGKVLGEGGGSSATLARAIHWALEEGAHVISMSLGIDFPGYVDWLVNTRNMQVAPATSLTLEEYRANVNLFTELARFVAAYEVFGQGTLIVAASGNESDRPNYEIAVAPPAASTGIVAVSALEQTPQGLRVADFANNQADIAAPGVDIVSAEAGTSGLVSMSGTSMATPHVAGVAALWAQRQMEMTGRVEHLSLLAQLVASGTREGLVADSEEDDVGTGLVQAPLT